MAGTILVPISCAAPPVLGLDDLPVLVDPGSVLDRRRL